MLQIVTGKFFRDVELTVTEHRHLLYTNAWVMQGGRLTLPMATLDWSTDLEHISAVTVESTEKLESVQLNGEPEILVSTGGRELLEDIANVLSFALNVTFSSSLDEARRLIPSEMDERDRSRPSHVLRRTFDPRVVLLDSDLHEAASFVSCLVGLSREHYRAVTRSIRQVVAAGRRVSDDPSAAFTMFVSALESLATSEGIDDLTWDALASEKRRKYEDAFGELQLAEEQVGRLQRAVLEAEHAGLKRRFVGWVLENISSPYYREEAVAAVNPVSASRLKKALGQSYDLRSRSVHVLAEMPPEASVFTSRSEQFRPAGGKTTISFEGFNRLSRHVLRNYIQALPEVAGEEFDYRVDLPNIMQVEIASQYWVWDTRGLDLKSSGRYLIGFIEALCSTLADPTGGTQVPDMRAVLAEIERLAPGASGKARFSLTAIYVLWHAFLDAKHHRPNSQKFLDQYSIALFSTPNMAGFATAVLVQRDLSWTADAWTGLLDERLQRQANADQYPAKFDGALAVRAACELLGADRGSEAIDAARKAIEEVPGNKVLIDFEIGVRSGSSEEPDLYSFVLGLSRESTVSESEA